MFIPSHISKVIHTYIRAQLIIKSVTPVFCDQQRTIHDVNYCYDRSGYVDSTAAADAASAVAIKTAAATAYTAARIAAAAIENSVSVRKSPDRPTGRRGSLARARD